MFIKKHWAGVQKRLSRYRHLSRRQILAATGLGVLLVTASVLGIVHNRQEVSKVDTPVAQSETPAESPTPSPPSPEAPKSSGPQLLWEWNAGKPIAGYWNVATPALEVYNDEAQTYYNDPANVRIENGALLLEAHKKGSGYSSGRVDTEGILSVTPGTRLEASIKLPKGKGVWPAFWLLSANQPYTARLNPSDADWEQERFYMHDGEIDVMEAYGMYPGAVEATVNTFLSSPEKSYKLPRDPDGFHTYAFDYKADELVFSVDGVPFFSYKKTSASPDQWPFTADNRFYVILNLAMGGTGGGAIVNGPGDSWRMEVSSVKYYKL